MRIESWRVVVKRKDGTVAVTATPYPKHAQAEEAARKHFENMLSSLDDLVQEVGIAPAEIIMDAYETIITTSKE